jgi:hypothetical protein
MNKSILLTAFWISALLLGIISPTLAQGPTSITAVNPIEGTVGTEVTIHGAGFGAKHGEVLIGEEKCKVQEWSDSQITCEVYKPQAPGEYTLTVLRQGDKKPAEPLTFSYFAMRQPNLLQGELAQDGDTVTVLGAFFGDKKGEIRIGYLEGGAGGEVVIEKQKIVDWSMDAIRFEIPAGLIGKFVLKVSNQVGAGFALLDLGGGTALLGDIPNPQGWPEGQGFHSENTGSGVWFKGNFYVFYLTNPTWPDHPTVQCKIFDPASGNFASCPGTMPNLYTYAIPVTVVTKDAAGQDKELWLFHVTGSKTILFSRFDGSNWLWIPWAGGLSQTPPTVDWYVTDEKNYAPAAVFNPVTRQVTLYVTYQGHINFAQTSNGETWTHAGAIYPSSAGGLSAVYHQGSVNGNPYDTLLTFVDGTGQDFVYYLKDQGHGGFIHQYLLYHSGQASLVNLDNDPAGEVALVYNSTNTTMIRKLVNDVFSDETAIFTLVDLGTGQGYYYWSGKPTAAIIQWPDATHHLMLFYTYSWEVWMADDYDYVGPFCKIVDVETLD